MSKPKLRLLCCTALLLAPLLPGQQPSGRRRATPAADTTHPDTAAPRDSLSRFLASVRYRALGPAAYSGRVTAIAAPHGTEPRPKTFYIGAAGGGVWKTTNG